MISALLLAGALTLPTPDLTCRVRNKQGQLVRSMKRRAMFLRMIGYADGKVPKGYAVDHVIPLALGACDLPGNLELLPVAEWRKKSGWERRAAWSSGAYIRLLQHALDGCSDGSTPKELCDAIWKR